LHCCACDIESLATQTDPHGVVTATCLQAPLPSHIPVLPHAVPSALQVSGSGMLLGTSAQVPLEQVSQVPQAAAPQQVWSTQWPDVHSVAREHEAPLALRPQLPPVQTLGLTQSRSTEQVVLHLWVVASQLMLPHDCAVTGWHAPAPSHVDNGVCTFIPAWHISVPHGVAVSAFWQAPAPLHLPLLPHSVVTAHWLAGSGSGKIPAPTKLQVPGDPSSVQLLQRSVHAVLQQTPLGAPAQCPELHSASAVHACPRAVKPQTPDLHRLGDWHEVLAVHPMKHAPVVLHT
jgi:hypothetical protein